MLGNEKSPLNVQLNSSWSVIFYRILVCLLAVILLWITTLQLAVDITKSYISVPALSYTISTCKESYRLVNSQRMEYEACAERQTAACNLELDVAHQAELFRVESAQAAHNALLQTVKIRESRCSARWDGLKSSILAYKESRVQMRASEIDPHFTIRLALEYNSKCSATQISRVRSLLDDVAVEATPANMTRNERSGQLDSYSRRSDSRVMRMAQYTSALKTYNTHYISNKTQSLQALSRALLRQVAQVQIPSFGAQLEQIKAPLGELLACFGIGSDNSPAKLSDTCSIPELVEIDEAYRNMQQDAQAAAQQAREMLNDFQDELEMFTSAVQRALVRADALFSSIAGATGIITWLLNNADVFRISTDFCGRGEPDWCSFTALEWDVPMIYPPKLPVFAEIPDASFLWGKVRTALRSVGAEIDIGSLGIRDSVETLVESIDLTFAMDVRFSPEDYNPPHYPRAIHSQNRDANVSVEEEDELAEQRQDSQTFRENLADLYVDVDAEAAAARATVASKTGNSSMSGLKNFALPLQSLQQQFLSSFSGHWATFNPGKIDTKMWLSAFESVQSFLFFFDYIYRYLHTILIIQRHWSRTDGRLSPINLKADKPTLAPSKKVQMILKYVDVVGLQFATVIVVVGVVVYSLAAAYMQSYAAYTHACVIGDRNSTFLIRSTNSLAYNYASSDGNGKLADGIHAYNLRVSELCGKHGPSTQNSYETAYQQLQTVNATFYTSSSRIGLVDNCLNRESVDELYSILCCSSSGAYGSVIPERQNASALIDTCRRLSSNSAQSHVDAAFNCPTRENTGAALLPPSAEIGDPACNVKTWPLLGMKQYNFSAKSQHHSNISSDASPAFSCQALPRCTVSCR
jgi:hypothetical protein